MGVWGDGNYENDSAADALAHVVEQLVSEVEKGLASYKNEHLTVLDIEDEVMAYVQILKSIVEGMRPTKTGVVADVLFPDYGPSAEILTGWKEQVLSAHLRYFGEGASDSGRYRVIRDTFDQFIQLRAGVRR
jgi:hypothetical protein